MKIKKEKSEIINDYLHDSFESVSEMIVGSKVGDDIPLAKGIDLEDLKAGDKNPMFVVVRVLSETVSRNGNAYTREVLESVRDQIMEKKPDGFLGHLDEDERATKFPDPQTIWIGAKLTTDNSGQAQLIAKGYVLPGANIRTYLSKSAKAGKQVSVSVYGQASRRFIRSKKHYEIDTFNLESIDWARSGAQGVENANLLAITSESMKTRKDIIASATKDELVELNPDVVSEIAEEAKEEVISEMDSKAKAPKPSKEATEALATLGEMKEQLGEKPLEAIAEMQNDLSFASSRLSEMTANSELEERVSDPVARKVIKSMVVSEMASTKLSDEEVAKAKEESKTIAEMTAKKAVDSVLESEEAKAVIQEMIASKAPVNPEKNKGDGDTPKYLNIK